MSDQPSGGDPSEPVTLTSVNTEFEAETIAQSLRAQGIDARAVDGGLAGFRAGTPAEVHVMVLRANLERARHAMRAIKADSVDIAWDELNPEAPEEMDPSWGPTGARRWAWTIVVLIVVPIGIFLTAMFSKSNSPTAVRALGPATLFIGLILVVSLWVSGRDDAGAGEG